MIKFPGWWQRNENGPPDLDEVMRDLGQKFHQMFGGKGGGGQRQTPQSPKSVPLPIFPILLVILLVWIATGFYIVDQGSVGVVQRFGKYVESTDPGPRWHWPYPVEMATVVNIDQVQRLEVGYRSSGEGSGIKARVPKESLMLTEDENIIDLQFAVQYKLKNAKDYLFNNRDTDKAVISAAETAIREVVGKNKLDNLLQKGLADTSARMQTILDSYNAGVSIISVTQQGAQPPEQVQEAFEDVNRANQDNQRQINEGQAYANDVIPKARGTASRLLAEAAGYKLKVENEARGNASRFEQILTQYNTAPDVTRQRLYIEAQEQIMSSVSKVLVDQKGGNSLLYLPLDKMMNPNTVTSPQAQTSAQTASTTTSDRMVVQDERPHDVLNGRDRGER